MKSLFRPASWPPVILAWSFLLLLPFGRASELPMFIMAILGGVLIWKHGRQVVWEGGAKTFSLLFLCIWIPIVLSVPDSLWFTKSLSTALTHPRIYFAGVYLIWVLRQAIASERLLRISAWLLLFWVADALIQATVGYDLLGYPYPARLNGIFGSHDWKLGLTLAMLSPLVWEYVSRYGAKWQLVLTWLGTAAVVMLASNREAWIVFAVATLLWVWMYARRAGMNPLKLLVPIVLTAGIAAGGAYYVNPKFAERVDVSLAAADFSFEGLNRASSSRMSVWKNAVTVLENHPLNGAGTRAYRYAYAKYAEPGDPYVNADGTGIIYAHQLLLEIGSETGAFGLIGLALFFALFMRSRPRSRELESMKWATWLGVFAWLFPINSHTALYSAYWSLLLGWLLAISQRDGGRDKQRGQKEPSSDDF